jgi:hypothetical protein
MYTINEKKRIPTNKYKKKTLKKQGGHFFAPNPKPYT